MNANVRGLLRAGIIAAIVLCIIGWGILRTGFLAATLTATWSYDYSLAPACSVARPVDCIDHFEILDITNQEKHRLVQVVKNPPSGVGKTDGITTGFRYGPPFGEITFSVVAARRAQDGSIATSNPYAARTEVNIRPGVKASLLF